MFVGMQQLVLGRMECFCFVVEEMLRARYDLFSLGDISHLCVMIL